MAVVGSAYVRLLPMASGFADAAKAELQPELDAISAETAAATEKAGVGGGESMAGGLATGMASKESDVEEAAGGLAGAGGRGLSQVEGEADKAGKAAASNLSGPLSKVSGIISSSLGAVGISMGKTGEQGAAMGEKIAGGAGQASGALGGIAAVGGVALGAVAIGSAVAAAAAIKLGIDFQTATTHLASSAKISVAQANAIGQAFLDTGGTTIYTGQQMVEALTPVAGQLNLMQGAALTAAQSVGFMKVAGDLAEASNSSLNDTTKVLTTTLQAFGAKAGDAAQYSDVLFNTSRATGTSIDTLGASFQKLHSTLGAVTPDIGQLGGILIDLTQHGETGRKALSAINTSLNGLLAPTTAVSNAQKLMGLSVFNASGQFVGFGSLIDQLQPKLAGMTQQQQLAALKALGFGTANKALLTTILAGSAAYDKATSAASQSGAVADAAAKQSKTLGHEWDTIKASAIDLGTKIGVKLLPYVQRFIGYLVDGAKYLMQHKKLLEDLAIAFGVTLVAAIGVFVGVAIAAISFTTVALAGLPIVIGIIVAAIVLLATHWKQVWTDVKNWFDDAVNFIRTKLGFWGTLALVFIAPWLLIAVHWQAIWHTIQGVVAAVVAAVRPYLAALTQIVTGAFQIIESIVAGTFGTVEAVVITAWQVVEAIIATTIGVIEGIVRAFAALFTGNWTALWNALSSIVSTVLGGIESVIKSIFNGIVGVFVATWATITGVFSGAVSVIEGTLSAAWTAVGGAVTAAWNGIVSFFTGIPNAIVTALGSGLGVLLQWGKDLVTGIANGVTGAAGAIGKALKAAVTGAVNDVKNAVNSIPVIGGALSAIGLATGGYITKPTFALVGEAGPEFVIPESDLKGAFGANVQPLPPSLAGLGGAAGSSSASTTAAAGASSGSLLAMLVELNRQTLQVLTEQLAAQKSPSTLTLQGQLPGSNAVQEIATGIAR